MFHLTFDKESSEVLHIHSRNTAETSILYVCVFASV